MLKSKEEFELEMKKKMKELDNTLDIDSVSKRIDDKKKEKLEKIDSEVAAKKRGRPAKKNK